MHAARVYRHGYPELKKDAYASKEKLPHDIVDEFILDNCRTLEDEYIVEKLKEMGFAGANRWNVGYRRRKLGQRKYLRGEIQKHRAWVRVQAIKKYGKGCELCSFHFAIDVHHIIPRYEGGAHDIDNLMVLCPNCHALITRCSLIIASRKDIPNTRKKIRARIKNLYFDLW